MGRQAQLHLFADDCQQLLYFIQQRDPVVIADWTSTSENVAEVLQPCKKGGWYCLWNQALLPRFSRKLVPESVRGPYYRVDSALPVIEFSYPAPVQELWNNRPAHTQGRIWAG